MGFEYGSKKMEMANDLLTYMPAILVISCIDDEVAFVDGVRENSINPSEAAACPSLLTSFAICMTAGFGNIK
jgi:hypothetical protein